MDNTGVYYSNFDGEKKPPHSIQGESLDNQHQEPKTHTPKHAPKLQSQDTFNSDIVNMNFESGDWSNEPDLDQQFEDNWSRRQAQFENDNFPIEESAQHGHMEDPMAKWSQMQMPPEKDGPFEETKLDYPPPSIVISNTDFNTDGVAAHQEGEFVTTPAIATSAQDGTRLSDTVPGPDGSFAVDQANTDPFTRIQQEQYDSALKEFDATHANQVPPFFNGGSTPATGDAATFNSDMNQVIPSAIKTDKAMFEPKTVKFSEEVEKKSPPHIGPDLTSTLFGDGQPLVVQTNTEGMSRARVRWITAFNKISSHINEVNTLIPVLEKKFIF